MFQLKKMISAVSDINIERLNAIRNYFKTGATKEYLFRKQQLQNLKNSILNHEEELYKCLYNDLKKNKEEAWVTEIGFVIAEINAALKNLRKWMRRKKAGVNLLNFPSANFILPEPLGVVLKPSEFAPATALVMKKIIENVFKQEYIFYAEGKGEVIIPQMMNNFIFDHIFYTGSTATGKIIYKMAAENLTPVTLELGGKSPCIVESDANITVAARRIAMTKFSNAGQMCVAPDYLLVHSAIKDAFIDKLISTIKNFYTTDVVSNNEYAKIINEKQFDRLVKYLDEGSILYGGKYNKKQLFIEPTLIENISIEDAVMKEEIFGPIFPVISFNSAEEAKNIIEENPNPLAFYIYTSSKQKENYWLNAVAFGGGCINNSSWHLTNHHLPFGGRGFSGIGKYHGKYSFETFSHYKAIMKTPTWFDPALRYPPLKGRLNIFKKITGS